MIDAGQPHVFSDSEEEKLRQFEILAAEANTVREKDKILIRGLFQNFYNRRLNVGIGFQRAYGSILAGDYFDLKRLPDDNFLFIFADISGHGLPAYTTLIRLRSAITISIQEMAAIYEKNEFIDTDYLINSINIKFTDVMDESNSFDFASVIFTFMYNERDKFHLKFYNRSMLFPIVLKKIDGVVAKVHNLNYEDREWTPVKGYLLGSDVKKIVGPQYYNTPTCSFTLNENDSILFYSDGIIEAYGKDNHLEDFGEERLIQVLLENQSLAPQLIVHELFNSVYEFIGHPQYQKDDMTAVLIDFPSMKI
jgi:hypothetical protein